MKRITAHFFREEAGREPVKDWLLTLASEDRKIVGRDIAIIEFGWPIGKPTCHPIRDGLREVRSTIKRGKVEARTYFAIEGGDMILLHGHEGKGGQDREIALALKRWKNYQERKRILVGKAQKS